MDLDSLLYLGSSCSNIFSHVEGLRYLIQWMRLNPAYNQQITIPQDVDQIEDEHELRTALRGYIANALDVQPNDPALLVQAGILAF